MCADELEKKPRLAREVANRGEMCIWLEREMLEASPRLGQAAWAGWTAADREQK